MAEVGRAETPIFTWNPVEQMWVQETGGAAKPPPIPNDIHAIQTWFLDPDEKEWIQTVLGPMGRQLAAQWRGAYRVPDQAVARRTPSPKKRRPLPLLGAGIIVIALIGGVAVAAPGLLNTPQDSTITPHPSPNAAVPPAPGSSGAATPAATAPDASPTPPDESSDPSAAPTGPAATARSRTPAPPTPPPPPPPEYVTPVVGPVGTVFHITFIGLPAAAPYRTTYTRGTIVTGYVTGEVPSNGVVTFDLRTNTANFPPETYFFTIRAGGAVRTVTFRIN